MNRGAARVNLKTTWLGEKGSYWGDAELNMLLDEANRQVYDLACEADPGYYLSVTGPFAYAAGLERLDVTGAGYLNAKPKRLLGVERLASNAAVSSSNVPEPLQPIPFSELGRWYGQMWSSTDDAGYGYCLQGDYLYVVPLASGTLYLRVKWHPHLADMAGDNAVLLGGQLDHHHHLVVLTAATMALVKPREQCPQLIQIWQLARDRLRGDLGNRQIQESRHVRWVMR